MMYRFLRKRIKKLIQPAHPHVHLLVHEKTTIGRGCGRWVATGRKPYSYNLRYAYGHTMRQAYENYMRAYYHLTPKEHIHVNSL